ncbi:CHASE2 domain-containing protein [Merismopedia glauca]|nr:CHASE2 domain-containing protein [Merismopedia glauca]
MPTWLLLSFVTFSLTSFLSLIGSIEPLELFFYDRAVRKLRPKFSTNSIVLVALNEQDIKKYGWPLSDATLAELLSKLDRQKPVAIGLDIYRNVPVAPGTEHLNRFFREKNRVIGIEKVISSGLESGIPPNNILKLKRQIASSDIPVDPDGVIRRGLLYPYAQDDPAMPSLSLALAFMYLDTKGIKSKFNDDGSLQLGQKTFFPLNQTDGGYASIDAGSYQTLIDYSGSPGSFTTVSLSQVLEDELPQNTGNGKIVIVGATAPSLNDLQRTPYAAIMSGMEIQANLTNQIVQSALGERISLATLPDYLEFCYLFALVLVFSYLLHIAPKIHYNVILFLLFFLFVLSVSSGAFYWSYWLPLANSLLSLGFISISSAFIKQLEQIKAQNLELKNLTDTLHLKVQLQAESLMESEKMASLGRLVAAISHEIKNPLTFVFSLSHALQNETLTDEGKNYLNSLIENAQRIDRTINDILAFSYPGQIQLISINLGQLLDETINLAWTSFTNEFKDGQVTISTDLSDLYLVTNPNYLQIAFLNIILNGMQASYLKGESPEIQVGCTYLADTREILIKIRDNGAGIDISDLDRIFEPFFTTKALGRGTGLGLWISYQIVTQLGGKILVDSCPLEYTEFKIIFPKSK